ncbi:MAG: alpha/beta fold hydrolase [Vicinamibacterales bacterium]
MFLHGWGLTRDSLRGIGILFQQSFRIHLIDLPGFGDAPGPPGPWGTPEYATLVARFIEARLTGPVILVGHSFGGRVAVRLAAMRLPQVEGVTLIGVPGLPVQGWSRQRLRRSGIRLLRQVLQLGKPLTGSGPLDWHTRRFGSRDYLAAGAMRQVLVKTVTEDLTEAARGTLVPFLLIYGTDDTETPPWLGARYQALLAPRATLHVLPHKDHHMYSGTGAHLCAFKIRQWLAASGWAEAHAGR